MGSPSPRPRPSGQYLSIRHFRRKEIFVARVAVTARPGCGTECHCRTGCGSITVVSTLVTSSAGDTPSNQGGDGPTPPSRSRASRGPRFPGVNPQSCGRAPSSRPNPSANPVGGTEEGVRTPVAHHAPRPPSARSALADPATAAPRPRWYRCTTALAALAAFAVVLTGGATAAHAEPTVAEIERQIDEDWNKLEPIIERHNATRQDLAAKRKQADALAAQIGPLEKQVDQAMEKVGALAVRAYKGEQRLRRQRPAGQPARRARWSGSSNCSTSSPSTSSRTCGRSPTCATSWPRKKAPLDEMVVQLGRTEAQLAAKKKQINAEIDRLQKLRLRVVRQRRRRAAAPRPLPGRLSRRRRPAPRSKFACAQIGKPYVWGAEGPNSYDCSGLMLAAWAKAGVSLPHNAAQQRRVDRDRQPGRAAPGRPGLLLQRPAPRRHVRRRRLGGARLPGRGADQDEEGRRRPDPQLRPARLRCKEGPFLTDPVAGGPFLTRGGSGQRVGQVRQFCQERLGVGPRWPW